MLIIAIGLIALIVCIFLAKYFNLWIQAKMTQANVEDLGAGRDVVPQGEPEHHRPLEDHGLPGGPVREGRRDDPEPSRPTTWPAATCPTSSGP